LPPENKKPGRSCRAFWSAKTSTQRSQRTQRRKSMFCALSDPGGDSHAQSCYLPSEDRSLVHLFTRFSDLRIFLLFGAFPFALREQWQSCRISSPFYSSGGCDGIAPSSHHKEAGLVGCCQRTVTAVKHKVIKTQSNTKPSLDQVFGA
jgi:hypothetical protein